MYTSTPSSVSGFLDLSSDTATRPSDAMRAFTAHAPVGDDQRGEDPTVNALQAEAAVLLGKKAALFVPSATMANQIAIRVHTRPGDEVYCHENAHIRIYEGGAPSALSGVQLCPLPGARGGFTAQVLASALRPDDPHYARPRLVCLENTHNHNGGTVLRRAEVAAVAHDHRLALHLDGARLLNAAVRLGTPAAELCAPFDSVTLCLSKGLGAPGGAILTGSVDFMHEAIRWRKIFGGAMRQAGVLAAGGLYGLRHNVERLADDHRNAARLAESLAQIPGVRLDPAPETNLVFVDVSGLHMSGEEAQTRLLAAGVRCSGGGSRLRFVTHLDVSATDIETVITAARSAWA